MKNIPNRQKDFDIDIISNNHKDTFSNTVPSYIRRNRRIVILKNIGISLLVFIIAFLMMFLFSRYHKVKHLNNIIDDSSIDVNQVITTTTTVVPSKGYVSVKSANVRSSPNKDNDNNILFILYQNDVFDIISFDGYWYKIRYDGMVGYISQKMIEFY